MTNKNEAIEYKVGLLLQRFNLIEKQLSVILTKYINPSTREGNEGRDFLVNYVFHNSVVNFASKIKLFIGLNEKNKLVKIENDKLYRLMHLRNAIAHSDTGIRNLTINLNYPAGDPKRSRSYYYIESIKKNGKLVAVASDEAFNELSELIEYVGKKLTEVQMKFEQ